MREVIEKIIVTENEARTIVEAVGAEAERVLSDARKRASEIVERSRLEARTEAARIVEEAVGEAEEEKKVLLSQAASRIQSGIDVDEVARECAVQAVVRCICGMP